METNHLTSFPFEKQALSSDITASISRRFAGGFVDLLFSFTLAYVIPFIGPLLSIVYFLNKDAFPFSDGQSIGKKLLQTRVIKQTNGHQVTKDYPASILRSVTLFIPILNFIEVIRMLLNRERFGDKWAGTVVVKA